MFASISAASLSFIVLAIYLLKQYLSFNFSFRLSLQGLHFGAISQYYFSIYIAVIALLLLYLDYFFRNLLSKKKGV
jgi:preprotein translocase subunit SecF